jgi:hypothetical protein
MIPKSGYRFSEKIMLYAERGGRRPQKGHDGDGERKHAGRLFRGDHRAPRRVGDVGEILRRHRRGAEPPRHRVRVGNEVDVGAVEAGEQQIIDRRARRANGRRPRPRVLSRLRGPCRTDSSWARLACKWRGRKQQRRC